MTFDILVVITILLGAVFGAWKGLAWQVASILSLVAGFVVAIPLSGPLAPLFGSSAPLNRFVAVAVLYAVVSLGIYIIALCYRTAIQKWKLEQWDRHLGGVMGAVKGFLLCLTVTYFAVTLAASLRDPILTTRTGKLMAHTMSAVHPIWPPGVHDILHPYVHRLDESPKPPPQNPTEAPSK
jgi:membrane protein required for colicin V production